MTIGIIITNYNSWEIAIHCLEEHLRFAGPHIEKIVLVDDCSTTTTNYIFPPKVSIIRNAQNLGFVKSVNVGFKNLTTDIIVLFDADAAPLMDYTKTIIKNFTEDELLAVVGFSTFDKNFQQTGSSEMEPGVLSLLLGQMMYHKLQHFFKVTNDNLVVYSCTMAIRRNAVQDVGGFDENFEWLDPDNDFCMSLRKSGWKIKFNDQLKAYHEGGGTAQVVSHRVLRFYKNRWYLLRKHGKIKHVGLIKNLILGRLQLEYFFLKIFGKILFKDPLVYQDKLNGRKHIIDFCRQNYH